MRGVHQSPAASAEPGERVDDEHLRRVRAGPVVPVGDA